MTGMRAAGDSPAPHTETLARKLALAVMVLTIAFVLLVIYTVTEHNQTIDDNTRKVNAVVCMVIGGTPDSTAGIVAKARHDSHCPPYGKDPNFRLYKRLIVVPAHKAHR